METISNLRADKLHKARKCLSASQSHSKNSNDSDGRILRSHLVTCSQPSIKSDYNLRMKYKPVLRTKTSKSKTLTHPKIVKHSTPIKTKKVKNRAKKEKEKVKSLVPKTSKSSKSCEKNRDKQSVFVNTSTQDNELSDANNFEFTISDFEAPQPFIKFYKQIADPVTKELQPGYSYCVLLPWIKFDWDLEIIQPIMIMIKEQEIKKCGLIFPFEAHLFTEENDLVVTFGKYRIPVRILAAARHLGCLSSQFVSNMGFYIEFGISRPVIRRFDKFYSLERNVEKFSETMRPRVSLSQKVLMELFQIDSEKESYPDTDWIDDSILYDTESEIKIDVGFSDEDGNETTIEEDSNSEKYNIREDSSSSNNEAATSSGFISYERNGNQISSLKKDECKTRVAKKVPTTEIEKVVSKDVPSSYINDYFMEKTSKGQLIKEADQIITEILKPIKASIVPYEPTSKATRALIDLVERLLLINKAILNDQITISTHVVEFPDPTIKNELKDSIFLEGVLQLRLSRYNFAMRKAKLRNPSSILYSIVKYAFPKNYWENVTLKSTLSEPEAITASNDEFDDCKKQPLSTILGFPDPFDFPLQGTFSIERGEARIVKLIEHCVRRANLETFSNDTYRALRLRLSKTLSALNSSSRKKYSAETTQESESQTDSEDEGQMISKMNEHTSTRRNLLRAFEKVSLTEK